MLRRVKMRNEPDIIYHGIIILAAESSAQTTIYYFSLYIFFLPSSSVFARTRLLYAIFFTGERPRLHRVGKAVRWRSGCASHRVHRPARATERASLVLRAEGRTRSRPSKVDLRAARRGSGSPARPPISIRPQPPAPRTMHRSMAFSTTFKRTNLGSMRKKSRVRIKHTVRIRVNIVYYDDNIIKLQ